jgi:hypothetical protein
MEPGDQINVVARFSEDDPVAGDQSLVIRVQPGSGGAALTIIRCFLGGANLTIQTSPTDVAPQGDDEACVGPTTDSNGLTNEITLADPVVNALDGDATAEEILLIVRLTAPTCTNQVYTFQSAQPSTDPPIAGAESVTCSVVTPAPTATATAEPPRDTCFVPGGPLQDKPPACAVVVTANPNVVACGGRSLITASVRDRDGHVIPGYGFHFATDQGLLIAGPPNNAETEQAAAVLQLFPPGSSNPTGSLSSTVVVSVGTTLGTVQGTVTVQQYCPTSSQVAGNIQLTSSAPNVPCNGRVFLAGTLKDRQGNPVPDGTEITFLASAGSVSKSAIAAGAGATPSAGSGNNPSVTVTTQGGTANLIYTADGGATGTVVITAASGNEFGYLNLPVCSQVAGVTPPNTGQRIVPPSTGDAGLAAD